MVRLEQTTKIKHCLNSGAIPSLFDWDVQIKYSNYTYWLIHRCNASAAWFRINIFTTAEHTPLVDMHVSWLVVQSHNGPSHPSIQRQLESLHSQYWPEYRLAGCGLLMASHWHWPHTHSPRPEHRGWFRIPCWFGLKLWQANSFILHQYKAISKDQHLTHDDVSLYEHKTHNQTRLSPFATFTSFPKCYIS